jgi:hypothetical protein
VKDFAQITGFAGINEIAVQLQDNCGNVAGRL